MPASAEDAAADPSAWSATKPARCCRSARPRVELDRRRRPPRAPRSAFAQPRQLAHQPRSARSPSQRAPRPAPPPRSIPPSSRGPHHEAVQAGSAAHASRLPQPGAVARDHVQAERPPCTRRTAARPARPGAGAARRAGRGRRVRTRAPPAARTALDPRAAGRTPRATRRPSPGPQAVGDVFGIGVLREREREVRQAHDGMVLRRRRSVGHPDPRLPAPSWTVSARPWPRSVDVIAPPRRATPAIERRPRVGRRSRGRRASRLQGSCRRRAAVRWCARAPREHRQRPRQAERDADRDAAGHRPAEQRGQPRDVDRRRRHDRRPPRAPAGTRTPAPTPTRGSCRATPRPPGDGSSATGARRAPGRAPIPTIRATAIAASRALVDHPPAPERQPSAA